MADFDTAVAITLKNEGGYVNNPNDKGGATNMGITQRDMPDIDIQNLTVDQAKQYYREHFWQSLYDSITDQQAANKLFDMGVLFGVGTAVRLLQSSLALTQTRIFDSDTLMVVNTYSNPAFPLLDKYKTRLKIHVRWIVKQNPSQSVFLDGWLKRVDS